MSIVISIRGKKYRVNVDRMATCAGWLLSCIMMSSLSIWFLVQAINHYC